MFNKILFQAVVYSLANTSFILTGLDNVVLPGLRPLLSTFAALTTQRLKGESLIVERRLRRGATGPPTPGGIPSLVSAEERSPRFANLKSFSWSLQEYQQFCCDQQGGHDQPPPASGLWSRRQLPTSQCPGQLPWSHVKTPHVIYFRGVKICVRYFAFSGTRALHTG